MAFTSFQQVLASVFLTAQTLCSLAVALFLNSPFDVPIILLILENQFLGHCSDLSSFPWPLLLHGGQEVHPLEANDPQARRKDRVRPKNLNLAGKIRI